MMSKEQLEKSLEVFNQGYIVELEWKEDSSMWI